MKQVTVADKVYNEWLQAVKALKPRKQKHWQEWLRNQRGEKSRVRFNMSRVREDEYHPMSAVGSAFGVSDEAGVEALMAAMQANDTGNHYRNQSVKVPTAPGEPLGG